MEGRKGRNDKGKYRKNQSVSVPEQREAVKRDTLVGVEPLFHTYDAARPDGSYFDDRAADHVCNWIESELRHFEGEFAGEPFELLDWQQRLLRHVFGWKRLDGYRLYRRVYCEVGRKQGKSTLAAAVALYLAYGDDENSPQIVCAGADKDQAGVVYNAARNILSANTVLYDESAVYSSKKEIQLRNNPGGYIKPVSADAKRLYGLNIHGLIFDELMTQTNRELWNSLTTSSGARRQPLLFSISTAGWDTTSICFELHELTREIGEGSATDPSFCGVVYGAPSGADWDDPEMWERSNPSMGQTVDIQFYREQAEKVRAVPAEQNAFQTLYLCQWVGQEHTYLPLDHWDKCATPTSEPAKRKAFAGLDLSATTDLTALSVVAQNDDGTLDLYSYPFLPDEDLPDRERRDRAPYAQWAREGFLTLTHGRRVNYQAVRAKIHEIAEQFDLADLGYDRWGSEQLVQELESDGLTVVRIGQGHKDMSPPTKEFLAHVLDHTIHHGGDPLLRWTVGNFAVEIDAAENVKPSKKKAAQRIDPVVASIMALDGWNRRGRTEKRKPAIRNSYFDQFMTDKQVASAA
jgi:phage terminase large subunit-like protein